MKPLHKMIYLFVRKGEEIPFVIELVNGDFINAFFATKINGKVEVSCTI